MKKIHVLMLILLTSSVSIASAHIIKPWLCKPTAKSEVLDVPAGLGDCQVFEAKAPSGVMVAVIRCPDSVTTTSYKQ